MTQKYEFELLPEIKDGETLIIHVPVGNLPTEAAEAYVEQFKERFLTEIEHQSTTAKYFFVPKRS